MFAAEKNTHTKLAIWRKVLMITATASLAAACSADVHRFAYVGEEPVETASIPKSTYVEPATPAPVSRVESRTLAPVARTVQPQPRRLARAATSTTVMPGDTLYGLARRHKVSVSTLIDSNNLTPPYSLKAGQTLLIPGGGSNAGVLKTASRVKDVAGSSRSPGGAVHVVRQGETLYSISRSMGVKPADLIAANSLGDNTIWPGQKLRVPGNGGGSLLSTGKAAVAPARKVRLAGAFVPMPHKRPAATSARRVATARNTVKPLRTAALRQAAASARKPLAGVRKKYTTPIALPRPVVRKKAGTARPARLAKPASRSTSKFRWPLKGRVISGFGRKPNGARNDGINIAVPAGATVKAAENGVVAYAGNELKGYGNLVLIRHADDWVTAYAHVSRIMVKRGQKVRRGEIIAKAGQTGSVSRPQLHFEIRKGAQAVNPVPYMSGA